MTKASCKQKTPPARARGVLVRLEQEATLREEPENFLEPRDAAAAIEQLPDEPPASPAALVRRGELMSSVFQACALLAPGRSASAYRCQIGITTRMV